VIGLPGDTVQIAGDKVVINGRPLERVEARSDEDKVIFRESNGDGLYEVAYDKKPPAILPPPTRLTVPANHFFVMGDNRHNALDSRFFGPIAFEAIIAKKW
jgi:signal peptidase I